MLKTISFLFLLFVTLFSGISHSSDVTTGSMCTISESPDENIRWSIHRHNFSEDSSQFVFGVQKNRKIQSVACRSEDDPIVFSMRETTGGDFELYEYDSSRAIPLKQLTKNDTDDVDVTISTDGKVVAYQRRLADGRQAISLTLSDDSWEYPALTLASASPFVQPALSENGQWMVFVQLRPSFFALMRYDIALKKYTEIRKVPRRKKLYHPSISNDGNIVGWSENKLKNRYLVKNIEEGVITEVVNNTAGVEHGVLSSDGKKVIYSINDSATSEVLVTTLDTLEVEQVAYAFAAPMTTPTRALGAVWHDVAKEDSTSFDLISSSLVSNTERFPSSSSRITLTFDKGVDSESVNAGIYIKNNLTNEIFLTGTEELSWSYHIDYEEVINTDSEGSTGRGCGWWSGDECIAVTDNTIIYLYTSISDFDSGEYSLFVTTDLVSEEKGNSLQREHEYRFTVNKRQSFYASTSGSSVTGLFGGSGDIGTNEAELGFNIYNDVTATELFYKVILSNGEEREGSFAIGSAYVGGPGHWGYQTCSFAVVARSNSSSYIENEMNYRKVSVGIINDTNKDFEGTANVELCSDSGKCESFDFDLEVSADPDFEATPTNPVCMALVN